MPEFVGSALRDLLQDSCRAVAAVAQHCLLAWGELTPEGSKGSTKGPQLKRERSLCIGEGSASVSPRLPPAVRRDSSGMASIDQEQVCLADVESSDASCFEGDDFENLSVRSPMHEP